MLGTVGFMVLVLVAACLDGYGNIDELPAAPVSEFRVRGSVGEGARGLCLFVPGS